MTSKKGDRRGVESKTKQELRESPNYLETNVYEVARNFPLNHVKKNRWYFEFKDFGSSCHNFYVQNIISLRTV